MPTLTPSTGGGFTQAAAPATSVLPMFVLDPAPIVPMMLGASIVEVHTVSSDVVMTISVDCGPESSPETDACRARYVYPIEVWHTQGSMFGGTFTALADDSTTAYTCNLGSCGKPECGPSCVLDVTSAGSTKQLTTLLSQSCLMAHSALLFVTGDATKLPSWYYPTDGSSKLLSAWSQGAATETCAPATQTTASAAATTTTTAAMSSTTSQDQISPSSTSPSPTGTNNASTGSFDGVSWVKMTLAAVACLIISHA